MTIEYVAAPIGPTLAAIAVGMLPNLGSFAALTDQIPPPACCVRHRARSRTGLITLGGGPAVLGAFLSFRDYIRD